MSRDINEGLLASLLGKHVYPAYLAEFEFDSGTVAVWSGYGTLEWDGHTFTGLGNLVSVSPVVESQDLVAHNVTFNLNGVTTANISLALSEKPQGRPCTLWLGTVATNIRVGLEDESGAILLEDGGSYVVMENRAAENPAVIFKGLMNVMRGEVKIPVSTISLTAENIAILTRRARERRYTDADQQLEYPGDKFFEYTAQLQDKEIVW